VRKKSVARTAIDRHDDGHRRRAADAVRASRRGEAVVAADQRDLEAEEGVLQRPLKDVVVPRRLHDRREIEARADLDLEDGDEEPPIIPRKSVSIVRAGASSVTATTRGQESFLSGEAPSARSASTCSVTAMVPSSAVMPAPHRAATMRAVRTGPSLARDREDDTRPTKSFPPNWRGRRRSGAREPSREEGGQIRDGDRLHAEAVHLPEDLPPLHRPRASLKSLPRHDGRSRRGETPPSRTSGGAGQLPPRGPVDQQRRRGVDVRAHGAIVRARRAGAAFRTLRDRDSSGPPRDSLDRLGLARHP